MLHCEMCGSEIEGSGVLCPRCELRLHPDKKSKPKKGKIKLVKIYLMVISYILFIVFLISYMTISRICFSSNNLECYQLSSVFLILFSCFCFIAAVLVGEEALEEKLK